MSRIACRCKTWSYPVTQYASYFKISYTNQYRFFFFFKRSVSSYPLGDIFFFKRSVCERSFWLELDMALCISQFDSLLNSQAQRRTCISKWITNDFILCTRTRNFVPAAVPSLSLHFRISTHVSSLSKIARAAIPC